MTDARTRAFRGIAGLAFVVTAFAPLLASLGARRGGDVAVVLSAVLAVAVAVALARSSDAWDAFGSVVAGALALSCLTCFLGASIFVAGYDVGGWFALSALRAVAFTPLALALHRRAAHDAHDAVDRLILAVSAASLGALVETTLTVASARAQHLGYTGMAAPALGPALLGELVLATLGALAALVRGARWLRRWRRLLGSPGVRIEPRARWSGEVPARAWWSVAGAENDAVLVRRTVHEAGAYRAGDVDEALTAMPSAAGRVTRALWLRLATAAALLGATVGFAALRLGALRW
ncbi:MAG: hypothetical protein JWM10_4724 [Myxococcaceae bacterium]|nr:hypothetical protein [Myxococcaceae bacterium]